MSASAPPSGALSCSPVLTSNQLSYLLCGTQGEPPVPEDEYHIGIAGAGYVIENGKMDITGTSNRNWSRRTNEDAPGGVFKLEVNGGTQGDLRTRDVVDSFAADHSWRARAASITIGSGQNIYMGFGGYHNTGNADRFMRHSTLGITPIDALFAPYVITLDGGAWIMRLEPKFGSGVDEIIQTGVYAVDSDKISFNYSGLPPSMHWTSGSPSLLSVLARVHWREAPNSSAYYDLTSTHFIASHFFTIYCRSFPRPTLTLDAPAGDFTASTFDRFDYFNWPPA